MSVSVFQTVGSWLAPTADQLMWRVQTQDDPEAFAELVRRWEGPIQRLCLRLTGDVHRSQDLAQEAFSRLFARRKAYQPGGKVSSYLWRIALNLCYDELRRTKNRKETPLDEEPDGPTANIETLAIVAPAPDEALAQGEQAAVVRDAVAALPDRYRVIVILRHYENLKFREIAEVLELPEGTVKTRMVEALNMLARLLRPTLATNITLSPNRRARPRLGSFQTAAQGPNRSRHQNAERFSAPSPAGAPGRPAASLPLFSICGEAPTGVPQSL